MQFMEHIARHHVINDAPEVFNAYVGVLTALATGPKGARVIALLPSVKLHKCLLLNSSCTQGEVLPLHFLKIAISIYDLGGYAGPA